MPRVDFVVETPVSRSSRARQLEGMFDVPSAPHQRRVWSGDVPLEARSWHVGLIVGPSGAGKTQVARRLFGDAVDASLSWRGASVIDDFRHDISMEAVTTACQAVGFNTIPAWLRPFGVLSNGEQFRVSLARRLLELPDPVVVDEFTSVVDRQVAQIGAHAVQKFVRRQGRRFVAVTCHYDVLDWLQPDWVLEPATMTFAWRSVQSRPKLPVTVGPISYSAWCLFAPFHYLTNTLHRAARCWGLWVGSRLAAFAGCLYRPVSRGFTAPIMGISRLVTLPDWQGLGLAMRLVDTVAAVYAGIGMRTHMYPAHPSLVRTFDRSPAWSLIKMPGAYRASLSERSTLDAGGFGGRPNATFCYVGASADPADARRVVRYWSAQSPSRPRTGRNGSRRGASRTHA